MLMVHNKSSKQFEGGWISPAVLREQLKLLTAKEFTNVEIKECLDQFYHLYEVTKSEENGEEKFRIPQEEFKSAKSDKSKVSRKDRVPLILQRRTERVKTAWLIES